MGNRITVALIGFVLLLNGCGQSKTSHPVTENMPGKLVESHMPKTMPEDFDFAIHYGFGGGKNAVNTFDHTVTKDLVIDTATINDFSFTKLEKKKIYRKMQAINVMATKHLAFNKGCGQAPYKSFSLKARLNGKVKQFHWTNQHCGMTKDGHQLADVISFIDKIVTAKPSYKQLPESRGGYD